MIYFVNNVTCGWNLFLVRVSLILKKEKKKCKTLISDIIRKM